MSEPGIITVETHTSGGVEAIFLVGEWPEEAIFAGEFLRNAKANRLTVDEERIVIRLDNGSAVYRITERQDHLDRVVGVRES